MRFSCEHCGKKYVVKDELLPGRTYKSKCKSCGNIIIVKGDDGSSTGDDMAVLPVVEPPAAPVRTQPPPTPPRAPTPQAPPARPAAPPPPRAVHASTSPPAVAPRPPPPGRDDSGYIDLFDGKGFDDPAPGWPSEPVRRVTATVIPPPASPSVQQPVQDDPFRAARAVPPTPVHTTARLQQEPPVAIVQTAPPQRPHAPPRRSALPMVLGAVALVVVGAAATVAMLRPWTSPEGDAAPPPAPPPVATAKPATPPTPPPPAAEPPPPPTVAAQPPPATPPPAAQPEPAPAAEPPPAAEPDRKVAKVETLSASAVRRTLASGRRAFNKCLQNPSRGLDQPLPAHRISLRLTVEPGGKVSALGFSDPAVAKAPVGQCLKTAGLALVFPTFQGPAAIVEAPIDIPATPAPAAAAAATPAAAAPAPATAAATPAPAAEPEPAAPPPGPPVNVVEFADVSRTRSGGEIGDSRYSQKSDDTEITERQFSDGVLTYAGQVGKGNGSAYGGIGFYVNLQPGGHPVDASKYRYVTFRLSSPTTRTLRVRLQGPEQAVANAGCYPMMVLRVTESMKNYRVALEDFEPDFGCGGRARYPEDTLPKLVGFEVVDISVQNKPTRFSVGSISLHQ